MKSYIKIKPVYSGITSNYPYVNGIIWTCNSLYRGTTQAPITCDLVYIWQETLPDENGNPQQVEFISNSLSQFEMTADENLLNSWGPDSVIDDYVLTYDPNFERE
jgi:hypothetical protein